MSCPKKIAFILPFFLSFGCGEKEKVRTVYVDNSHQQNPEEGGQLNPATCKTEFLTLCAEVQAKIEAAQVQMGEHAKVGDMEAFYQDQLTLNELLEIRDSYQKGTSDVSPITQRYQALRDILAANDEDSKILGILSYQKEELAATREVFTAFGELTIDPAIVVESVADKPKTQILSASKAGTPWAAYWYPKRGRDLFEKADAPLQKLDRYLMANNLLSQITKWENEHYDAQAAEWEGLCDSWAMAAISTNEPTASKKLSNIDFTPSDLKAVAIKYYEGYKPKIFGRRYQGLASTDGLIQDLRPEAFHRIIQEYLGNRQLPIIIDEDPGPEIWSKPIFRMAFSITKDPKHNQALLVKAYPWMTRQRSKVDDVPTSLATDLAAPAYEYRLYYEAPSSPSSPLKIVAGEWLGTSLNFHPDMVFLPQSAENQDQPNPEMKKYREEIRKLLEKAGMLKS